LARSVHSERAPDDLEIRWHSWALDDLFLMIAEEEKKIRRDSPGSASNLIGKVFGAIGR